MLAMQLWFPIDYLVLPTLLSFLVCVLQWSASRSMPSARGRFTETHLAL